MSAFSHHQTSEEWENEHFVASIAWAGAAELQYKTWNTFGRSRIDLMCRTIMSPDKSPITTEEDISLATIAVFHAALAERRGYVIPDFEPLITPFANYMAFMRPNIQHGFQECDDNRITRDKCFNPFQGFHTVWHELSARAWSWQSCTEWGFFQVSDEKPGMPLELPIVSRLLTYDYFKSQCVRGFWKHEPPPPRIPNTDYINKWGGRNFSFPNVVHVGGEFDPWRPATPLFDAGFDHRAENAHVLDASGMFLLMENATHCEDYFRAHSGKECWDNDDSSKTIAGSRQCDAPRPILRAQEEIRNEVKRWLADRTSGKPAK